MESKGRGIARLTNMLRDEQWSDWLPIYAWIIEHDEGLILVDTGETARVQQRGYHPRWHPFYRRAVRFSVHPDEESARSCAQEASVSLTSATSSSPTSTPIMRADCTT